MTRAWITTLAFAAASAGPAVVAQQADPGKPPAPVVVPAGTAVPVRLTADLDVDVAHAGKMFSARVDDPITLADGVIAIPREARANIQAVAVSQSGDLKGADKISLKLASVAFGGKSYQTASEYATVQGKGEGKATARKVGGGAGLGALFGGLAGGGTGAAIGAAIGGTAGAAVAASGQEHLRLPAETRIQFTLSSPLRIEP